MGVSAAFGLPGALPPFGSNSDFLGNLGLMAAFLPVWGLEEPEAILRWSKGLREPLALDGVCKESTVFRVLRLSRPQ